MWLLWGIVLWKESLCKIWIVFILIKCICFIIKINHVWSLVKQHCLQTHCSPQNPLFSPKTHCFPTCALFIQLFWNKKYHWFRYIILWLIIWRIASFYLTELKYKTNKTFLHNIIKTDNGKVYHRGIDYNFTLALQCSSLPNKGCRARLSNFNLVSTIFARKNHIKYFETHLLSS